MAYRLCPDCRQPMLKTGQRRKHPDAYRHASGCPRDRSRGYLTRAFAEPKVQRVIQASLLAAGRKIMREAATKYLLPMPGCRCIACRHRRAWQKAIKRQKR